MADGKAVRAGKNVAKTIRRRGPRIASTGQEPADELAQLSPSFVLGREAGVTEEAARRGDRLTIGSGCVAQGPADLRMEVAERCAIGLQPIEEALLRGVPAPGMIVAAALRAG